MSTTKKTIVIAADHAGFDLKTRVILHLQEKGYSVVDFGAYSAERVDYPDFAHRLADSIESGTYQFGVLICGSANGVSMTANKHAGVRCAVCWNEEISTLARSHNNANVLALPARFIEKDMAEKCVDLFLKTSFEGGRHSDRVEKINC